MSNNKKDNPFEVILGFVVLFGLGWLFFSKVLPAVGSFLFTPSSDKQYCGQSDEVQYAKTDAAAKYAYKSCLKRKKNV